MDSSLDLGESVFKCKPFVCVLKANQKSIRCDACFARLQPLAAIVCSRCQRMWYCSDRCHDDHSYIHSFECFAKNSLHELIVQKWTKVREDCDWIRFKDREEFLTHSLLLLRLLFQQKLEKNSMFCLPNGRLVSYDDIEEPVCHRLRPLDDNDEEEMTDEVMYNFGQWLKQIRIILESDLLRTRFGPVDENALSRAFRITVRHALYVSDTTFLHVIGKALYIEMCFIGHSCLPNCGPLFNGNNELELRVLCVENIRSFADLRYDSQIEMTGMTSQDIRESLLVRDIHCHCWRCCQESVAQVDFQKSVTNANLKYGNWPEVDYALAMNSPIEEAINSYTKTYGEFHPMVTCLLLWKLRNEWILATQQMKERKHFLQTFETLKAAVRVTHGQNHVFFRLLSSVDKECQMFAIEKTIEDKRSACWQTIANTIEEIIPKTEIDQKLA